MLKHRPTAALAIAAAIALAAPVAAQAESPGLDALDEFRHGRSDRPAVQNRFFTKAERFEISPTLGYVPNNPFAKRYVGGVDVGYHFTETLSARGGVSYSPDLGASDLKGLTRAVVFIARQGEGGNFQQPLDKVTLAANFGASWAPLYGKINLVGETVLNFDLYGFAGLGMVSKVNYYAVFDRDVGVRLEDGAPLNEVKVSPALGLGTNFFLNQTIALKLDTRFNLYVDNEPQYDPNEAIQQQRLYNNFVVSAGLSFFFPQMKPRIYDF